MIKYWPRIYSSKEIGCLQEIETILDKLQDITPLIEIRHYLVTKVSECAHSLNFNVAERALLLMHNPVLLAVITYDKQGLLPIVVDALLENINRKEKNHILLLEHNGVFI